MTTERPGTSPSASAPTEAPPPTARPRLALLDGLRLVAALAVVLFHWTAWHHGHWAQGDSAAEVWPGLSQVTSVGALGVQLFFIISGFVILLSCFGKSPARFIGSRIGRLYPAYWVAVLAAAALLFWIWPSFGTERVPAEILPNLTMFQAGMGVGHMDGVYWTLWVEMKFYLWILAFTLIGMTSRRVLAFALAWPVAGNVLLWVLQSTGQNAAWVQNVFFPEYSALFGGGMALFLVYRFGHSTARWTAVGVNVVLAAHWSARVQHRETLELTGYDYPLWLYWAIVVGLFAAVALMTLTRLAWVRLPAAVFAGKLTYPVYLLHQLWGWWLILLLSPHLPPAIVLGLTLSAVLTAAWVLHRTVEAPCGRPLTRVVTGGLERLPVVGGYLGAVHGPAGHRAGGAAPAGHRRYAAV